MISIVIPTLNAEKTLAAAFTPLVPAVVDGLVREVIVADGGSTDRTLDIADLCGAETVRAFRGRGSQLSAGAARSRHPWLLFLHADTVLGHGWDHETREFIATIETGEKPDLAAAFRFSLNDTGMAPRILETLVGARCAALRWPYGDQGLLVSRRLYDEAGGFRSLPLMEDIDFARRLGRKRIAMLRTKAVTSASRYKSDGYMKRILRNQMCLALFLLHAPMTSIIRMYGSGGDAMGGLKPLPPAE